MLGIGAAHQKDSNGIAWKQNKDFENLLKRLNEHTVHNTPGGNGDEEIKAEVVMDSHKKEKRKHGDGEDGSARKRKRKRSNDHEEPENSTLQPVAIRWDEVIEEKAHSVEVKKSVTYLPRHRAYVVNFLFVNSRLMHFRSHRARAIAAKNISSKSLVHISEILGVAPTTPIPSQNSIRETSQGTLTSTSYADGLENSKITTSTKSLTDYFKEKLDARSSKPTDSATSSPPCNNTEKSEENDFYDAPRMGLGSSYLRLDIMSETRVEETQKVGWSKFSSLVSSSLLAATSSLSSHVALSTEKEDNVEDARIAQITEVASESKEDKDKMKKRVKEVKKKKISNNGPQQGDADDQLKGNKLNHDRKGKVKKSEEKDGSINEEEDKRKRRKEKRDFKKMTRGLELRSSTSLAKGEEVDSAIEKALRKDKRKQKAEKSGVLADEGKKKKPDSGHPAAETHR